MQTVFPKIATILLAICSVAFMGLAIAGYYGRPDPLAEMAATELDNYQFSSAGGETVSWSVRQIMGDEDGNIEQEKSHDNAYAAIADAYQMESSRLASATTKMNDLATTLRDRLTIIRAQQAADVKALETAITNLKSKLVALKAEREGLSKDLQALMVETTSVREETTRRRQDVMRLQNELEELRTDSFRLVSIQRVLTDRLVRLQLENQALDIRLKQFEDLSSQPAAGQTETE